MIPALIGALGGLATAALGSSLQSKLNRDAWDRMNEYNSPKNQIALMREANINPASSFYGTKTLDSTASNPMATPDLPGALNAASQHAVNSLTMSNLKAQNDNLKEQNRVLSADAKSKELDNQLKEAQLPNELIRQQGIGNVHVNIDSNGVVSFGSTLYNDDGSQSYYPIFDKDGNTLPGTATEMSYNYYRAFRDAIREGFNVDKDYFESKLLEIERDLKDEFGAKTALATINQLKALANQSNENARTLRLDNDAIESLGFGQTGMKILGNNSAKVLEVVLKSLLRSKK